MSDPRIKPRVPRVNWEHPLAKGLVGAWAFQDGGGSVLRDVSGNGFDGVITDATWITDRYGGALDFDRSGDYVNLGASVLQGVRTIAFTWTFPNGWSSAEVTSAYLYSRTGWPSNDDSFRALATYLGNLDFNFSIGASPFYIRTTQTTWGAGHPYHFVFMIDPVDGLKLYIDGVREVPLLFSNTTAAVPATAEPLYIAHRPAGVPYGDGVGISGDFRLWNRALLPGEVESLYYDSWSLYRQPEPVLASAPGGLFQFDQLTGGMPDLRGGMV